MDSTGQQLDQAAQDAELPPPPLPPPGSFRVAHLDQARLAAQLRSLRERSEGRSNSAVKSIQLSGLLIVLLTVAVPIAGLLGVLPQGLERLDWSIPGMVLALVMIGGGLGVVYRAPRLPAYFYRRAWQEQLHRGQCLLLADDERLRVLQSRLPAPVLGAASSAAKLPTVAQRLEFAAFHLESLRRPDDGPEGARVWVARRGELARQAAAQFENLVVIWAGCCCGAVFAPAWLLLAGYGLLLGPRVIEGCAAISAFVDHYLEEPRIELDDLPPPEPTRGWWAGLLAPWRS